jgi:hypothetical protein
MELGVITLVAKCSVIDAKIHLVQFGLGRVAMLWYLCC